MTERSQTTDRANNRLRRQSRNKRADVLWAIASLIMLQVGFAVTLETGVIKLEDATSFGAKANQLRAQIAAVADDPFVAVAFGSSRVMNGFDAGSLIEPLGDFAGRRAVVHNFGISGCGNIYSYLSLEKLIAEGVTPDLVLVEVYPMLLRPGAEQAWFAANELRSQNFENTERYGIETVSRAWHEKWLVPWHTYRFSILNLVAPKLLPLKLRENWALKSDEHGWKAVDNRLGQETLDRQVEKFSADAAGFRLGGDSYRALQDTISLCQKHNIECGLFWMPESEAIREEYHSVMQSKIERSFRELCRKFGIQIINARDWVDDSGFYDTCHLNRAGAKEFTRRLARQALPQLQKRALARARGADQTLIR